MAQKRGEAWSSQEERGRPPRGGVENEAYALEEESWETKEKTPALIPVSAVILKGNVSGDKDTFLSSAPDHYRSSRDTLGL